MKTTMLVAIVVVLHCVAIGSLVLMQGCGTTMPPTQSTSEVTMPPSIMAEQPIVLPVVTPVIPVFASDTTEYVVQSGDTLGGIASRHNLRVSDITAINQLKNQNRINVGQRILLPGKVTVKNPSVSSTRRTSTKSTAVKQVSDGSGYVVKSGDSLSKIASRYGVTSQALRDANGITGDKIIVGQKLAIPGAAKKDDAEVKAPGLTGEEKDAVVPPADAVSDADVTAATEAPADVTAAPAPVSQPTGKFRTHIVEEGEDLLAVSMSEAVSITRIKEANGLKDDTIKPGQVLKIPLSE
jgi:LysM repeat protein